MLLLDERGRDIEVHGEGQMISVGTTGSCHVSTKYYISQDSTQHWRM